MTTCAKTIQDKITTNDVGSITQIGPNTLMPLSFSISQKQLLSITMLKNDTALFTITLQSDNPPVGNVGVTAQFFFYNEANQTINDVGQVRITEMIMTFQKDLNPGTYFICISSSYATFTGTLIGVFAGYIPSARIFPRSISSGQIATVSSLTLPPRSTQCAQPLIFDFLEGSLPPGLEFLSNGVIEGLIPNMDCIDDNKDLSPSADWYYSNNDGTMDAWDRRWRFKVRVRIQSNHSASFLPRFSDGQRMSIDYLSEGEGGVANTDSGEIVKYSDNIGNHNDKVFIITHGIGSINVAMQVRRNSSPYNVVEPELEVVDNNSVRVSFSQVPDTNQYRITIIGEQDFRVTPMMILGASGEQAKLSLLTDTDYMKAQDDQWFCIAVYNNWSWEKARLTAQQPTITPIPVVEPITIPAEICCEEEPPKEAFTPKPIIPLCTPCDAAAEAEKEKLKAFLIWTNNNINTHTDYGNNSLELDYVKAFIDTFKGTDIYNNLVAETTTTALTNAQKLDAIWKQRLESQVDGRNIHDDDYRVLTGRTQENTKLPITILSYAGENSQVTFA